MRTGYIPKHTRFLLGTIAAATILFLWGSPSLEAQNEVPPAQTVWQHTGRIYINPDTGNAIYAGYVVHLNGVSDSLFKGSPGEGTAYFTFSTDVISLTPMPSNGDLALTLVSAGSLNVYYNPSPTGDWGDPTSFSRGQLIATFKRNQSLFPLFTTVGVHALSETLEWSRPFSFNGQTYDLNRMVPNGVTFASFFSTTPQQTGLSDYSIAYSASGTTIAVGKAGHP